MVGIQDCFYLFQAARGKFSTNNYPPRRAAQSDHLARANFRSQLPVHENPHITAAAREAAITFNQDCGSP
ncbi:hypothetical protein MY55_15880 [Chromobacterium subtsugae]|nr:hypothetical protein MY55_15880 [Chromobacterium subtsugae]